MPRAGTVDRDEDNPPSWAGRVSFAILGVILLSLSAYVLASVPDLKAQQVEIRGKQETETTQRAADVKRLEEKDAAGDARLNRFEDKLDRILEAVRKP